MDAADRPRVLFLCTGNSCRSQMAEGWSRALRATDFTAYSAGTHPQRLNPLAVRAMAEVGIDISGGTPKSPGEVPAPVHLVVTVCDAAHAACPLIPGTRTLHAPFDDPPRLARHATSDEDALPHYRRVRDQIRDLVQNLKP